jgi:hypothetical protein
MPGEASMDKFFHCLWLRSARVTGTAAFLVFFCAGPALAGQAPTPPVPTISASLGNCSADFLVKDGQNRPIYDVKIDVTFHYGFLNLHKESLEVFTNSDGKARFEGLPNYVKKPLEFRLQYHDRQKTVVDDLNSTCKASEPIILP